MTRTLDTPHNLTIWRTIERNVTRVQNCQQFEPFTERVKKTPTIHDVRQTGVENTIRVLPLRYLSKFWHSPRLYVSTLDFGLDIPKKYLPNVGNFRLLVFG